MYTHIIQRKWKVIKRREDEEDEREEEVTKVIRKKTCSRDKERAFVVDKRKKIETFSFKMKNKENEFKRRYKTSEREKKEMIEREKLTKVFLMREQTE